MSGANEVRVFWWVVKDIREAKHMMKIWPGLAAGGFESRQEAQSLIDTNPAHTGDVPVKIVVTMIEDRKEVP